MSQLSYEQCVQLQGYLVLNLSQTELAEFLWVNQSSISRELNRCRKLWSPYSAEVAWKDRKQKRTAANKQVHTKILLWSKLANYIKDKLGITWSPEQIAGRWKKETWETITHPTIYSFVYEHWPEEIIKLFRRKGKKYRKGWKRGSIIRNRISIHERPEVANKRWRIWDFEWDTIVGLSKKDRIVTNVCRLSRYIMATLILHQKGSKLSIETSIALYMMMKDLPEKYLNSITLDNWVEFADHEYLTEMLWIEVYFADPYSSRQRWTNENSNWLIRSFIPKWTDFSSLTPKILDYYVNLINNRPRKCLGWKTATEVFFEIN